MRKLVPAYNPLQAPYIEIRATVRLPGETNGIPNIKTETKYQVAPSAKKIATFIVNSIFGSDIVTQTEGLQINWLMPTLKECLEEGIYQGESFIYIHKFDNKIYLECIRKNEIHDLVQKYDKVISCKIKQEYDGIFKDDEIIYELIRDIKLENGITYMNLKAFAVSEKGKRTPISIQQFNQRTNNNYLDKYILPYEIIINVDLGQDFFKESEKLLNEEMVVINTMADEIEKTKTRIVTSQHYQSGDIVSNWQPATTHFDVRNLTVGTLTDYFTLLPGDKEHQIFEFLQGDIRTEQYVATYKFYDYQIIQLAGLSPASFGYEKDAYQNVDNINLQKNASDMTIEAIKTQIEPQINHLIENIVKAQQSEGIQENLLPTELQWDYGANEKFDDIDKLQLLNKIQSVGAIPYSMKAKILMPILNKLIDEGIDEKSIDELIKAHNEEEKAMNIEFGEI